MKVDYNEEEREAHPSYGQISFSRVSGHQRFYGSELEQDHFIKMEVKQSECLKTLSKEWYFASGLPLLEIRMTASQFSEMITSMNHGGGIPCTIETVNQVPVAKLPIPESRKEFTHRKFQERMKGFGDTIRERQQEAKALVNKKSLSKEDMRQLQLYLDWLTGEVERNIPFFAECFQETMDEIVLEAKTEVENAIQHKISTLGLQALHNQNKLLE